MSLFTKKGCWYTCSVCGYKKKGNSVFLMVHSKEHQREYQLDMIKEMKSLIALGDHLLSTVKDPVRLSAIKESQSYRRAIIAEYQQKLAELEVKNESKAGR